MKLRGGETSESRNLYLAVDMSLRSLARPLHLELVAQLAREPPQNIEFVSSLAESENLLISFRRLLMLAHTCFLGAMLEWPKTQCYMLVDAKCRHRDH